jgi:hypothetical protein
MIHQPYERRRCKADDSRGTARGAMMMTLTTFGMVNRLPSAPEAYDNMKAEEIMR